MVSLRAQIIAVETAVTENVRLGLDLARIPIAVDGGLRWLLQRMLWRAYDVLS